MSQSYEVILGHVTQSNTDFLSYKVNPLNTSSFILREQSFDSVTIYPSQEYC